jgi:hypothetical protein
MPHTWIRRPDLVVPPEIDGIYHVGFAIKEMPRHWFSRFDVRATIRATLRCDGGRIHDITSVVHAQIMVPIDTLEMAIGSVLAGPWLKGVWWATRGSKIISGILRKEAQVEQTIKLITDSTDAICSGRFDPKSIAKIVVREPIWLNEKYQPMFVINPNRADADPMRGRRIG